MPNTQKASGQIYRIFYKFSLILNRLYLWEIRTIRGILFSVEYKFFHILRHFIH